MTQPAKPTPARKTREATTRIVVWTLVAGAAAAAIGLWWISPIVASAPILYVMSRSRPRPDATATRRLTLRWTVALLLTIMVASAFLPDRTLASVPFGPGVQASVGEWMAGLRGPAESVWWLAAAAVVYVALALASAGVVGWLALAVFVGMAAIHAAFVYEHGHNLLQVTLVALSPWQWAFLGGAVLLAAPLANFSRSRIFGRSGAGPTAVERRQALIGAGLLVVAILLRAALAGPYTWLVQRWTVV